MDRGRKKRKSRGDSRSDKVGDRHDVIRIEAPFIGVSWLFSLETWFRNIYHDIETILVVIVIIQRT